MAQGKWLFVWELIFFAHWEPLFLHGQVEPVHVPCLLSELLLIPIFSRDGLINLASNFYFISPNSIREKL